MGWLRLVDSLKLYVSFAKEPYKRDYILQKRPIILRSLLIVATPYVVSRMPEAVLGDEFTPQHTLLQRKNVYLNIFDARTFAHTRAILD